MDHQRGNRKANHNSRRNEAGNESQGRVGSYPETVAQPTALEQRRGEACTHQGHHPAGRAHHVGHGLAGRIPPVHHRIDGSPKVPAQPQKNEKAQRPSFQSALHKRRFYPCPVAKATAATLPSWEGPDSTRE